ncbi:hypothetical protein [Ruminococcus sp.]|uniref:hypothetical protein n=1 Tax=Ruminococcus sp. TaxID=41978 RepID=UPI0025FDBEAF|nr:hypothetical protein [Ruminococcus sp.]
MQMSQNTPDGTTTECIWLAEGSVCELMKSCRCHGTSCSFRRTSAQDRRAAAAWQSRMASLPEEQQRRIAKKYYGGNMPWK